MPSELIEGGIYWKRSAGNKLFNRGIILVGALGIGLGFAIWDGIHKNDSGLIAIGCGIIAVGALMLCFDDYIFLNWFRLRSTKGKLLYENARGLTTIDPSEIGVATIRLSKIRTMDEERTNPNKIISLYILSKLKRRKTLLNIKFMDDAGLAEREFETILQRIKGMLLDSGHRFEESESPTSWYSTIEYEVKLKVSE